ncbi:hypothetical protein SUGI_0596820 [Cryptomeria japonica]|nr:hypothetical protein SUGI_0596820 [Cryptomeria japonica]
MCSLVLIVGIVIIQCEWTQIFQYSTGRSRRGSVVKWARDDLLHAVKEFVPIYHTRPIKNNKFGMGFDHSFGVWFITRWLKPDLMIESDDLKGKQFIDFGSISWKSVMEEYGISDHSKVVVFFDDHQNELKRLKQALRAGFRHLIFEDNHDTGTGDMYTLRHICDQFHIKGRSRRGSTVKWTRDDLEHAVKEFVPIYHTRPIKNNKFGMGFDDSFGVWFITRWLKPDLMIESGKQFIDFRSIPWKSVMEEYGISDQRKVVVFFDDHQNELKRLKQALRAGFRHLIFEDNYDTGTGDHYSLRQICDQSHIKGGGHSCNEDSNEARMRATRKQFWEKALDIQELCGSGDAWWGVRGHMRDNFNHSFEIISHTEHVENSKFVESVLDLYWELPPVAGPSLTHQTRYDPARSSEPIVPDDQRYLFRKLGLSSLNNSVFNGYTQMVYVQISE